MLLLFLACSPPAPRAPPTAAAGVSVPARLLGEALESPVIHDRLASLCDDVGHRMTGSAGLEAALAWGRARMEEDGLQAVREEPVEVQVWERGGLERARLLLPTERDLPILGLGGTMATPPGGVEAEVVVVDDLDHLERLGGAVEGRIVLIDQPFTDYAGTVGIRVHGPSRAAQHGAVAVLIRSVTSRSLATPHTGALRYDPDLPRIPAAALTVEDASSLRRLTEAGRPVRVRLELSGAWRGSGRSANVVGEVPGREAPEEVVVVGCHIDSWDVGQGAQDDGAGCVMALEAGRLIARLDPPPRRTVRVVLFTNEESGLAGGPAYRDAHVGERHVAAIEADTGAGAPLGFRVDVRRAPTGASRDEVAGRVLEELRPELVELLAPLGATLLEAGGAGADVGPLVEATGALGLGLLQDMTDYWPIHHTHADTFDKVDPELLRKNAAAVTLATWWAADRPVAP